MPPEGETEAEAEATKTETETEAGERELAGAALQSALKKERAARAEAEKAAKDAAAKLKKIEDAQLSETERFRQEAEESKRRLDELEASIERERTERTRSDHVRKAAKDFADPEDAIALLAARGELDSIDDEKDAVAALKTLAKEKPHLLKQPEKGSGLEQILRNGEQQLGQKADEALKQKGLNIVPDTDLVEMSVEELAALKASNPELYYRSVDAFGRSDREFAVAR